MKSQECAREENKAVTRKRSEKSANLFREWRVLILMPLSFTTFLAYTTLPDANPWIGLSIFLVTFYLSAMVMLRLSLGETLIHMLSVLSELWRSAE